MSKDQAFDLIVKKDINIRFFRYCKDKRRGLHFFNQTRSEENQLTYDEWTNLKELI